MLSYQLSHLVFSGTPKLSMNRMHACVWAFCVVKELLPLTTGTEYGLDDGNRFVCACVRERLRERERKREREKEIERERERE